MHAINTWTYPRYILRKRLTHIIYFLWRRSIMSRLSPLNTKTFLWGNQGLHMTRTWHRRQILEQNVEFFAVNVCSVNLLVFTVPQLPIHLNFKVVNLNALTFCFWFPWWYQFKYKRLNNFKKFSRTCTLILNISLIVN